MERVRQVFKGRFESGRRLHAFESFPGTEFAMARLPEGIVGSKERKSVTGTQSQW